MMGPRRYIPLSLLALVVIVLGVVLLKRGQATPATVTLPVIDERGYHSNPTSSASFISPNGSTVALSSAVAKQFSGPEWISSFVMPTEDDPSNILLSTDTVTWKQASEASISCASINRIYRYNLTTQQLTKLYEETSTSGSPMQATHCRILRTAGRVGSKLILLIDDPQNSPGPCTQIWADYADRFVSFDPTLSTSMLAPFIVSSDKIASARVAEQQCLQTLSQ